MSPKKGKKKPDPGSSLPDVSRRPSFLEQTASQDYPGRSTVTRSSTLTFNLIREMSDHPDIAFCLGFLSIPLKRAKLTYAGETGDEAKDAKIGEFMEEVYEPVIYKYLEDTAHAMEYGFAAHETRWEPYDSAALGKEAIGLKTFKPQVPDNVSFVEDPKDGSLLSIKVRQGGTGEVELKTSDSKALLYTHNWVPSPNAIWGGRFGHSDYHRIKKTYEKSRAVEQLMVRWYENKGDPIPIVEFDPTVTRDAAGGTIDPSARALDLGENARLGKAISIPKGRDKDGSPVSFWTFKYAETSDRVPAFETGLNYWSVRTMRGLLIPELALAQGDKGTYGLGLSHGDFFVWRLEDLLARLIEPLNLYNVPRLLAFNFGKGARGRIQTPGLRETDRDHIKAAVDKLLEMFGTGKKLTPQHRDWLEEQTGLPMDDVEIEEAEVIEIPEKKVEPPIPPVLPVVTPEPEKKEPEPAPVPEPLKHSHPHKFARRLTVGAVQINTPLVDGRPARIGQEIATFLADLEGRSGIQKFAADWASLEGEALSKLRGVVDEMETKFVSDVQAIVESLVDEATKLRQTATVEVAFTGKYESTLKDYMYRIMQAGAGTSAALYGVDQANLRPGAYENAWISSQASTITQGNMVRLRRDAVNEAMTGVDKDRQGKVVAWNVKQIFETYKEAGLPTSVSAWSNACVNMGRLLIDDYVKKGGLGASEEVVGYMRSAVLDDSVCQLCEYYDGMVIEEDNPDSDEFIADQHLGDRCIVFSVLSSMRTQFREFNYRPAPSDLINDYRTLNWTPKMRRRLGP